MCVLKFGFLISYLPVMLFTVEVTLIGPKNVQHNEIMSIGLIALEKFENELGVAVTVNGNRYQATKMF